MTTMSSRVLPTTEEVKASDFAPGQRLLFYGRVYRVAQVIPETYHLRFWLEDQTPGVEHEGVWRPVFGFDRPLPRLIEP